MNLYYLVFYSRHYNAHSRWAITAPSEDLARRRALDLETDRWSITGIEFVCTTADDVCRQL